MTNPDGRRAPSGGQAGGQTGGGAWAWPSQSSDSFQPETDVAVR